MAISNATERLSALATRRLPWFRRFVPRPAGDVGPGDRQQVVFVYRGILAAVPQPLRRVTLTGVRANAATLNGVRANRVALRGVV